MNNDYLKSKLSEISGLSRSIMIITENDHVDEIASYIEDVVDDMVDTLNMEDKLEKTSRCQSLHSCDHTWKKLCNSQEEFCPNCGERNDA